MCPVTNNTRWRGASRKRTETSRCFRPAPWPGHVPCPPYKRHHPLNDPKTKAAVRCQTTATPSLKPLLSLLIDSHEPLLGLDHSPLNEAPSDAMRRRLHAMVAPCPSNPPSLIPFPYPSSYPTQALCSRQVSRFLHPPLPSATLAKASYSLATRRPRRDQRRQPRKCRKFQVGLPASQPNVPPLVRGNKRSWTPRRS